MSLVKKDRLSNSANKKTKTNIKCVYGDPREYPTTGVTVVVGGQKFLLQVGVVDKLSEVCILGRDLPSLQKPEMCAVVTRF